MRSRLMGRLGGEWVRRRGVEGFGDGLGQSRGSRGRERGSGRRIETKWGLLGAEYADSRLRTSA